MCFCNKSYLTKAVISQYVNMSAYFQVIGTNKPCTSWNSRAGVSLKARFTKRNKKKLTFETVPVRRSDVASYCLTAYGPLLHVAASECHLIAHVLLMRTAWPLLARRTNISTGTGLNPRTLRHVTGIQWYVLLFLGVHCTALGKMVPPTNQTLRPLLPSRTPGGAQTGFYLYRLPRLRPLLGRENLILS